MFFDKDSNSHNVCNDMYYDDVLLEEVESAKFEFNLSLNLMNGFLQSYR